VNNVGIVSLGSMGETIAQSVHESGNTVHWSSEGRSERTLNRARQIRWAIEHRTIRELFDSSDIIICIGRGGVAEETIESATKFEFKGIYVDGNNLHGLESEQNIYSIAKAAGINYVEALFRGYPMGYDQGGGEDKRNVYLSGPHRSVEIVESLFSDGIWEVEIVLESAKSLNRTRFKRLF
jgi:6-phosphogluconate dehydrogenase (decarboxylating)